jgi:endonuclease/exonuclease/phosphatase family metal-dependent hydrolase
VIDIADLDQRHRRTLPTIITGDFNAAPDTAGIRFLSGLQALNRHSVCYHDAWAVAGDGPGHTWSADNPLAATQIDLAIRHPATGAASTTSSSAPGTPIPPHRPESPPPGYSPTASRPGVAK